MLLCNAHGKDVYVKDRTQLPFVNEEYLVSDACYGSTLLDALRELYVFGAVEESCIPYTSNLGYKDKYKSLMYFSENQMLPLCNVISGPTEDMCSDFYINRKSGFQDGTPKRYYRAYHIYLLETNETVIRQAIFYNGPVVASMVVYSNFYTFNPKTEIYDATDGKIVGGHSVEITGWGVFKGIPYWEIKNTWGEGWGLEGYFRMKRGSNLCGIEENVFSLTPDFFYVPGTIVGSDTYCELEEWKKQRDYIETELTGLAGGIDPTTGYTRRVMNTFPYINFRRPISLKKVLKDRTVPLSKKKIILLLLLLIVVLFFSQIIILYKPK
jgi:hypothetical protein